MPDPKPLVAVVMGSSSDWETMQHAVEMLERFGVPHERQVVSAHRTPEWMAEFATGGRGPRHRGDHRRRRRARPTCRAWSRRTRVLPVLGVPVQSAALQGLDSLLSIVQMPGGVPVGTLAIGKAGATNAGLLAVAILANSRPELRRRLRAFREEQTQKVRQEHAAVNVRHPARRRARRARQRPARADVRHRGAAHGLSRPHLLARRGHADRPGRRRRGHRRVRRPRRAARVRARRSTWSRSSSRTCRSTAVAAHRGAGAGAAVGRGAAHRAAAAREKTFLADAGFPTVRRLPVPATLDELCDGARARRHAGRAQDRRLRLRRQGAARDRRAGRRPSASGRRSAHQEAVRRSVHRLQARDLGHRGARARRRRCASTPSFENRHRNHILDVTDCARRRCPPASRGEARRDRPRRSSRSCDVVGVLCVEFFLSTDGELLVNELAPRPHNSGHLTFDACVTSQFEQQVRAICGLPLGSTELLRPAAMANLLGDLWRSGEPNWAAACALPGRASCTSTARPSRARAARWATSRRMGAHRAARRRIASSPPATRC